MKGNRSEQLLKEPYVKEILKRLQAAEQAKRELEERFAIINALAWDHYTVYDVNMQTGNFRAVQVGTHRPSKWEWETGEEYSYEEFIRRYLKERILDEDKEDVLKLLSLDSIKEALSTESVHTGTYRSWNGTNMLHFQVICKAYQVEGQAHPHVLVGFRDIDDIVHKEEQQKAALKDALHMAKAASEAKTSFLGNMSHDIRTPMNAIIGFLTLMRDEVDNPEMVREYIQRIDAASHHLLSLINDVLDMNKIESGSTTLSLAEINLAKVITEISTIIHPQAKAKNQTFEVFASHLNFEHLLGDEVRINQILINLLSNAVKYTPENGTIELRVEEMPQVLSHYSRIRFTVSDNGMGMSEDYLKVIFDPFTREDTKAIKGIQGTGLGMAITKSLVDMMGGTITVDSKLGGGSTFVVELELRIQEQEDDPKFWSSRQITRMIVIDDDDEVCRNIVKTMTGAGVSTDYAVDGGPAVQMVRGAREAGKPYDIILLDWKMPGMNGLETARLIRKNSQVPILLLTSFDWREIEQEAVEIGVNHFMPKPFFMSTFKEAVRLIMGRAEEARHHESDVVKGMHILIVDDIEVNRMIMSKLLSTLGAEYDTACDGLEAVEKFMASPSGYDLILMDVQMPEMDGYKATRAIRASSHPFAAAVPIIAMTANAFVDDVRDAINSGMDAHIAKPVQVDNLKATIHQVLESRAATENL